MSPQYCYPNASGTRYQKIARPAIVWTICADGRRSRVEFIVKHVCEMAVAGEAGVQGDFG